ncbi:serine/threonine-protein phosphatase 6 regulatory ankyrin repeat subunit A-like [Schistocerca cancellata]|uniref:serine/threonine-protein phosphatase 6 regulatory ankyrin repeat subunit A-like n=1 Tax=Schistocerca cancellata TaxID=274614 RepID=UPI002118D204|nr:serine/threonine-protein phosphatase 6 regulatory ankyrin repeat subunit A-like [Schistocerca cancellata]
MSIDNDMRSAVYKGDVDALKELVSKGGNPNAKGYNDEPLLLYAAICNKVEVIRYLLKEACVPIELCDKRGRTALLTAASYGNLDAVQYLLSAGANILARTALDETALHLSARTKSVETFKFLQQSGIPVDALDIRGRTVLHHAAKSAYPKMVECILEGDWLHVDCQDKNGQTPLMLTADYPRSERDDVSWFSLKDGWVNKVITILLNAGADLSIKDVLGRTALHRTLGNSDNFQYLWKKSKDFTHSVDKKGQTPIHRALSGFRYHWNMHSVVRLLLEAGADVESCDAEGRTALAVAVERDSYYDVQTLIKAGAETSCFGKHFLTKCLHIAVWEQNVELTRRMLAEGADINGRYSSLDPDPQSTEKGHTVNCLGCFDSGLEVYADLSGYSPLFEALRSEKMLKLLIDAGADVNFKDNHGWSPLQRAFYGGNFKAFNMLLDVGADPYSVDDCGVSLLHMLSKRPMDKKEFSKITERLIQGEARVNVADHNSRTPLHYATREGNWKYLKILIDAGGDVNSVDVNGATPLLMLANRCYKETVQVLIDAGANITVGNINGQKIIHQASQLGNPKAIDYLMGVWPSAWGYDNHGNTVLHFATRNGNNRMRIIEHILRRKLVPVDERNDEGQTALAMLVQQGSNWRSLHREVKILLAEGASPFIKDNKGKTPLHIASSVDDVKVMETLIAAGVDITSKDVIGRTPLHWAAEAHSVGGLELLLQKPASIDEQDSDGQTPLMLAVGSSDAVNFLLRKGANFSVRDYSGKTALQQAIDHGSHGAVKFLWTAGSSFMDIPQEFRIRAAHLAATAGDEEMLDHLMSLGMSLSDCWWDPEHNTTLLHCAAQFSVEIVKKLMDSGHTEYARDNKGRTALHVAVTSENYIVTKYLVEEAHVPVNDRDADDRTPLMLAISSNWWYPDVCDMLEILVNAGADISAQDKDGNTVYQLAQRSWSDTTIDLLDYMQHRL